MKVFGRPEFLNLYYRYFSPLLRGVDIDVWNLDLYLLSPDEMPKTSPNSHRPHFAPPKTARIPVVNVPGIMPSVVFSALINVIAHEIGHFIHVTYLSNETPEDEIWQEWAELSGNHLDYESFEWRVADYGNARHPYPHIPIFEIFADDFRDWLLGRKPGRAYKKFFYNLWGQEYMTKVLMWIGNKEYVIDGEKYEMDVAPEIKNGRTLIPLRAVAEALECHVDWDGEERKVTIRK